jgi:membrane protease YdiL (CAAX protease family)
MNSNPARPREDRPYLQLLILAAYVLFGLIAGAILSFIVLIGLYGMTIISNPQALSGGSPDYVNGLKIAQILTTITTFLAPPLLLVLTERGKIKDFYSFKKPQPYILLMVLLIMAASLPLMEWLSAVNQKMVLPDVLKGLENWMREKEDDAMKMTILLLSMTDIPAFLINIFVIALLPAIGEELLFRGGLQRLFHKLFHNPHVAIWVSAIIFSAIHVQFFGFFPRLVLGAAFGYIYLWTGNLWYAMFAHFLNNAYAVCVAWYLQVHHMPLSEADNSTNFQWYGYLISLILTILLFIYLKAKTYGKQLD